MEKLCLITSYWNLLGEKLGGNQKSLPKAVKKIKKVWYEHLPRNSGFPDSKREILAIRGTLPQFPRHQLTLRIYHLYGTPNSAHFPDCQDSTHHIWVHKRFLLPSGGLTKVSTILSLQAKFEVSASYFQALPLVERQALDSRFPGLSEAEKASNHVVRLIGQNLVDRYMPRITEQWIIHRSIDLMTRNDPFPKDSLLEARLGPRRVAEWSGQIEYYYELLTKDYQEPEKPIE
ncbi:hypothetical protein K9N68_37140 (plasmid) [Kovacikia minuta CCNUW1]|uniref:hypothetical protein n=1 Tax=Kovacikia minuta TaxID=2931930 RepID=UPI001CCB66DF|nr:hypothetical protein [Kovacikia minuta]UBF29838.1 hypothetical protein K9N68_37140 [Kovacikia minuta CCNUW1]